MAEGPPRWVKGPERLLAGTRILDLRGVEYRHPGRDAGREFIVIDTPDWVNVVALTTDHRIVLVTQFRFGIDGLSLEIPGGVVEPGEDPLAAAQRELLEETGFAGDPARLLGTVHPNPAIQKNRCHLVLIENALWTRAPSLDPDEDISVTTASIDETLTWARSGRITHSLVLCALFHFEACWRARV